MFRLYNSRTKQKKSSKKKTVPQTPNKDVKPGKTSKSKENVSYISVLDSKADNEEMSNQSILRRTHFSQDFIINMSKQTDLTLKGLDKEAIKQSENGVNFDVSEEYSDQGRTNMNLEILKDIIDKHVEQDRLYFFLFVFSYFFKILISWYL